MNRLLFALIALLFSCDEDSKIYLKDSNGALCSLTVVSERGLLDRSVTDALKIHVGNELKGVPVPEPVIDINFLPIRAFKGFAQASRNILILKRDTLEKVLFQKNLFAKPQNVVLFQANDKDGLKRLVEDYSSQLVDTIKHMERREKLRRVLKSPNREKVLRDSLGIRLTMSSVFYIGPARDDHFFWASRNIPNGKEHLLIYEIPYKALSDSLKVEESIRKIRDSIGKKYIPGRRKGMYYTTADFPTGMQIVSINGRKAYETRGLWEVTDFAMGGPFLNYMIDDAGHQRYIVIEGFVFSPRQNKRNFLLEIESIAYSIKFL